MAFNFKRLLVTDVLGLLQLNEQWVKWRQENGVTFGIGFYSGVYAAQNYEIQKVDDPGTLWQKVLKYLDEAGKKEK